MIKRVLKWLLFSIIVVFIAIWWWAGGPGKAWREAKSYTNVIDVIFFRGTSTGSSFRLPWQPEFPAVPGISQGGGAGEAAVPEQTPQQKLAALENQYTELTMQAAEAKTFGTPSPFRRQVTITDAGTAKTSDPRKEYLDLRASPDNTAPVDITDWSLQSAYTGIRVPIPQSASPFMMGVVNVLEPTMLPPGTSAIVISGQSPVSVSFRENVCTGYLAQLQYFFPPLSNSCPAAATALPFTPENLRYYGDTCFDYLQSIPSCTAPLQGVPSNVSANCRSFAVNTLSYNGCVVNNRFHSYFALNSWRIYLGSDAELWRNSHDIIRLLDADGRTVDVITY